MNNIHGDWGMSMGAGMWIFWIVLILVVFFVARLITASSDRHTVTTSESLMEILEKRYASGEIDKEKFESMKKDLEK